MSRCATGVRGVDRISPLTRQTRVEQKGRGGNRGGNRGAHLGKDADPALQPVPYQMFHLGDRVVLVGVSDRQEEDSV